MSLDRLIQCSRWSELTDSMKFHATLAEYARSPTEFRLLNSPEPIVVGRGEDNGFALSVLQERFDASPSGGTPVRCVAKVFISLHFHFIILVIT